MKTTRFSLPVTRHDAFVADWRSWAEKRRGCQILPPPWPAGQPYATTNAGSDVVLAGDVDDDFLVQFPEWKLHVIG
jgi:hypothetical protein